MINLGSEDLQIKESKAIFNNGEAGVATDLKVTVASKKQDDHQNAPDYKLVLTDKDGGSINYAFYTNEDREKVINFKAKEINHLRNLFGAKMKDEFASYKEMVDTAMRSFHEALKDKGAIYAAGAYYGNIDYPKDFLQLDNAFQLTTNEKSGTLKLPKGALLQRPQPNGQADMKVDASGSAHTMSGSAPVQDTGSELPF